MRSITPILIAIVATCSLVASNSVHAAECVGTGSRSTFGADSAAYFEVKSGQSCHFAFNLEGVVQSSKIMTRPKNGTVRMLNLTSFEYKPKAGYKGPDSFAIEATGRVN
jgi:hypothetical protein